MEHSGHLPDMLSGLPSSPHVGHFVVGLRGGSRLLAIILSAVRKWAFVVPSASAAASAAALASRRVDAALAKKPPGSSLLDMLLGRSSLSFFIIAQHARAIMTVSEAATF